MDIEKILDLQDKALAGTLTEAEAAELEKATTSFDGKATEAQRDYIEMLLDQTGNYLEEYTNVPLNELTVEEASELIDDIKEDLDGFH